MRRFERLGQKPVAVWELDVDGANVTTREGIAGGSMRIASTEKFATPEAAQQHADALVKDWRSAGFIPITRIAAVEQEQPARRDERREWQSGSERRFREISQHDHQIRVARGIISASGYDQREGAPAVTKCRNIREASEMYDRLVGELRAEVAAEEAKTKAGEKQAADRKEAKRVARLKRNEHPELEALCRAAADAGPWAVYADWLIEKGDPIGEAAVLAMSGDPIAARRELGHHFEELGDALFELRHGFIHHVQLVIDRDADGASLPAVVRRVLSAPCCRFVDSIQFGLASPNGYDNSWAESLAALLEMPQAPHIRELRFNAYNLNDSEISWVGYGDLAFAWPKLPALELLHIRAGQDGNLGVLELPNLHTFIRESGGLRRSVIESLCAMPRVSLRHLELWTGSSNYGGEIQLEDVVAVMKSTPNLAHLGIVNSELSDDLLPMLSKSQLLPKLESLDLSRGIAAKTFTDYLVGNPAPYRHLAAFDLSENVLYDEEVEQIRAVLDNVLLADQRPDDREDDYEDDPGERYVALGE